MDHTTEELTRDKFLHNKQLCEERARERIREVVRYMDIKPTWSKLEMRLAESLDEAERYRNALAWIAALEFVFIAAGFLERIFG